MEKLKIFHSCIEQQTGENKQSEMYFISGPFYEFATSGLFTFVMKGMFGNGGQKTKQEESESVRLLQLHLADREQI